MKKLLIITTLIMQFALPIFAMDRSAHLSHKDMYAIITNTPNHADTELTAANALSNLNYKKTPVEYDWTCGCRAKISKPNINQLLAAIVIHMQSNSCAYYQKPMTDAKVKEEQTIIYDYLKKKYHQK